MSPRSPSQRGRGEPLPPGFRRPEGGLLRHLPSSRIAHDAVRFFLRRPMMWAAFTHKLVRGPSNSATGDAPFGLRGAAAAGQHLQDSQSLSPFPRQARPPSVPRSTDAEVTLRAQGGWRHQVPNRYLHPRSAAQAVGRKLRHSAKIDRRIFPDYFCFPESLPKSCGCGSTLERCVL